MAEGVGFGLLTALSIYLMREQLLYATHMPVNDHANFHLSVFSAYVEHLLRGAFPWWNPFSHGGEPLYPAMFQMRYTGPLSMVSVYALSAFTRDTVLMYNWWVFIHSWVGAVGAYLALRLVARHVSSRIIIMPALLIGSFILTPLRVSIVNPMFLWVPLIALIMDRMLRRGDGGARRFILLGLLLGLNWQSVFFTGPWLLVLFFALGAVLFKRCELMSLIMSPGGVVGIGLAMAIVILMMAPNVALYMEQGGFVYPLRMFSEGRPGDVTSLYPQQHEGGPEDLTSGIDMTYELISRSGSPATWWDYLQMVAPEGNRYAGPTGYRYWGRPSEAFLYVGLVPLMLAYLGLVRGRDPLKRVWMVVLAGFALLGLGAAGGLHELLYYIYPPVRFIRHTQSFGLYTLFALMYFAVLGADALIDWMGPEGHAGPWALAGMALAPALMAAQLGVAAHYAPGGGGVLRYAALALGVPLVALVVGRVFWPGSRNVMRAVVAIVLVACVADLGIRFRAMDFAVRGQPNPVRKYGLPLELPESPVYAASRGISEPALAVEGNGQVMRYASLMLHRSYVFSPVMDRTLRRAHRVPERDGPGPMGSMSYAMGTARWNGFFLLREYFELINAGIGPDTLSALFAVDAPVLSLKGRSVAMGYDEALDTLRAADPRMVADTVIVGPGGPVLEGGGGGPGAHGRVLEARYVGGGYDELSVTIETGGAALLLWADVYDEGWRATVDGASGVLHRANYAFKAVEIPGPGRHEVRFIYENGPVRWALVVFYGTAMCALIGAMAAGGRRGGKARAF